MMAGWSGSRSSRTGGSLPRPTFSPPMRSRSTPAGTCCLTAGSGVTRAGAETTRTPEMAANVVQPGSEAAQVYGSGFGGGRDAANLGDILERVLDKGLVIAGDIQVNLLDIEL